ncbi:histidinol phosphate phosphatase H [Moesziomyces antarcticus]|uniref:Related to HIS2 - histidinol-phosphatase n=2 Tax=Pseudozyma antarctica TaxID=84753 RepID=A0A5C3FT16_PSEA2|nr:histidinol phosphate phosphatase H [Moesziomyces antarcticus]GAK65481.1 histidinol phosphate phosphatase H [Moesziomyces antarcticus]SPO46489.1 related to HIS2 - histidinol-phosphatase [Moesziomyces antarcticus]
MPHSHHSHSGQFCSHAKDSLEHVLERAQALGFTHFHLSEHVPRQNPSELYPEELEAAITPDHLRDTFHSYLSEARRLQGAYSSRGLNVLVGCETENITSPGTLDYLTHTLGSDANTPPEKVGKGTVDYIVGSLHHSHAIPIDFDRETFDRSVESFASTAAHGDKKQAHLELVHTYLDDQLEVLKRLRPEVVGHFDLFRLFEPLLKLEEPQLWAKVERNVRFAVAYGALFECNAAAFRKGWSSAYPAPDVLRLIIKLGGRLCLSDDSHGVHAVGLNYTRLRHYLVDQGVDTLWYLEKDSEETAPTQNGPPTRFARGTVAKSMGPEWQSHPFWSHFTATLERESQP